MPKHASPFTEPTVGPETGPAPDDIELSSGPSSGPSPGPSSALALHAGLFALTCATTVWAGRLSYGSWTAGLSFGVSLMVILACHEMGHYVVARRHGIAVSLPYFIPLPPYISLGTLGAVIRMKQVIEDRNQLIDVGAAGPIAGLLAAVPLLVVGLWLSPLAQVESGVYLEGNSLLYLALKYLVFGQYLPSAAGSDVVLHPMAFAAWVGLLITMINLIPIGQLDGGHIACALLGTRHERWSRWLHRGLPVMALMVVGGLYWEAERAGLSHGAALGHGIWGALPWLLWAVLLLVLRRFSGGVYHPPVGITPLTPRRRLLVWGMLLLFLLLLTPVPFRPALP